MSDFLGLGIKTVVNAGGAQSRLGGSTLSPTVREAMSEASTRYVDIEALHDLVGERLAVATRNEAAAVSAGTASAIMIAVAAAIVGADPQRASVHPRHDGARPSVAVWRPHVAGVLAGADAEHENGYLNSIAAGGGSVKVFDDLSELRSSDAALVWFPGMFDIADEDQHLREAASLARRLGVCVIVDAADQIPPFARTWDYTTQMGADLALFSGGKGLNGPTSSGLIVGRGDLIKACRKHSGTEHGVGRTAKVGREELVGLMVAVDIAAQRDEDAIFDAHESSVLEWSKRLESLPIEIDIVRLGHCKQRVPRLLFRLPSGSRICRDSAIDALWNENPRISVLPEVEARVALSPQLLAEGEADYVADVVERTVVRHVAACEWCS